MDTVAIRDEFVDRINFPSTFCMSKQHFYTFIQNGSVCKMCVCVRARMHLHAANYV
jgi:hypothetical protein